MKYRSKTEYKLLLFCHEKLLFGYLHKRSDCDYNTVKHEL